MSRYPKSLPSLQKGAVLLESLIALLIFSFGVLALAGLQSAMMKNTDDAKYRAEAAFVAQRILGDIWVNTNLNADGTANLAEHVAAPAPIAQLPNGTTAVTVDGNRLITVTVTWQLPGRDTPHTYTASARVEGLS